MSIGKQVRWPSGSKNVLLQIGKIGGKAKPVAMSRALVPVWMQKLAKTPHTSHLQAFFSPIVKALGIAKGN